MHIRKQALKLSQGDFTVPDKFVLCIIERDEATDGVRGQMRRGTAATQFPLTENLTVIGI